MEKVFSVYISDFPPLAGKPLTGFSYPGFKLGHIEKIVELGRFVVVLESGERVTAQGSRSLKIGSPVRVFPPREILPAVMEEGEPQSYFLRNGGTQWEALLPLGFGGKKSSARLKIFVEEKMDSLWEKGPRTVYFIVWTQTEKLGKLQWSIYLKGRQVFLQVFAEKALFDLVSLKNLTAGVEKSLKSKGFALAAPTIYLERPFEVPEGFRLNVKG